MTRSSYADLDRDIVSGRVLVPPQERPQATSASGTYEHLQVTVAQSVLGPRSLPEVKPLRRDLPEVKPFAKASKLTALQAPLDAESREGAAAELQKDMLVNSSMSPIECKLKLQQ